MLDPAYATMSPPERANHWVMLLHRQMRWAGEDGVREISILDRALLEQMRRDDPDVDALLPMVLTRLAAGWMREPAGFVAQVNRQMGTAFEVDAATAATLPGRPMPGQAERPPPQPAPRKPWWRWW
ncbi:hypothetical protein [Lysobacter enzymogenes]|uniref:hypothetical protein n=1 Tax=Lysobacter enzymogenes TaxID=69 RepID=UPI001A96E159|nr:hypothetical protein [Lysobacter enzymogenes]QQP96646.1 hypothetical protein JHW38_00885 [Lysobacter enzymogenes]